MPDKLTWIRRTRWAAIVATVLLGMVVALQNRQPTETQLLFATVTMPQVFLILISGLVGFVIGVVTAFSLTRRRPGRRG